MYILGLFMKKIDIISQDSKEIQPNELENDPNNYPYLLTKMLGEYISNKGEIKVNYIIIIYIFRIMTFYRI
mgnify:CR=1 FL=1